MLFLAAATLFSPLIAQNLNEPPDGKVYFGAWLDTADSAAGALDGDRPVKFNQRMGFNASVFQYAQDLPIPAGSFSFPIEQIEATGTDALIYLTVYPRPSLDVADADIQLLALQLAKINASGRQVVMRFGPEMNGTFQSKCRELELLVQTKLPRGQQPTAFIILWKRVFEAIKTIAPLTAMVWAPSSGKPFLTSGNGYPYGSLKATGADLLLLDTNRDGTVNSLDDPYSPYYPGDAYVDWIGMSIYHYGSVSPWQDNVVTPSGFFESLVNDHGFYQSYAVAKGKPMMVAETGAAFHVDRPAGVGELAVKQTFWKSWMTDSVFLSKYVKIKLVCLFEFLKFEEITLRDFRISNSTLIRNAFIADFKAGGVSTRYISGKYIAPNTIIPTSGSNVRPATGTNSSALLVGWNRNSILVAAFIFACFFQ